MDAKLVAPVWLARVSKDEYSSDDHKANTAVVSFGDSGILGEALGLRRFSHGAVMHAVAKLPAKWAEFNRDFAAAVDDQDVLKATSLINDFAAAMSESEYADAGGNSYMLAAAWDGV